MAASSRHSALAALLALAVAALAGCGGHKAASEKHAADAGPDAGPADAGPDAGSQEDQATGDELDAIAKAFAAFYADELRWPLAAGDWDPRDPQAGPMAFTTADTALFAAPSYLPACTTTSRGPCWQGPFISGGSSLGDAQWLDAWGNPILFALIPTDDVIGTGLASAPHGAVVLWSMGPDGIDQTGCTAESGLGAPCTLDPNQLAAGQPSAASSDDIVVVVGPALDPLVFTEKLLAVLSQSYKSFDHDTGVWPFADCGWNPAPGADQQLYPQVYLASDTVLTTAPPPSPYCVEVAPATWNGSYLWSDVSTMVSPPMLDGWYHALMYTYIRPDDSEGGGTQAAPEGAIVLWSIGPDGIDQTGCTNGTPPCSFDIRDLATGQPSGQPSDDIIVVVGPATTKT